MEKLSKPQVREVVRMLGQRMVETSMLGLPATALMLGCGAEVDDVLLVMTTALAGIAVGMAALIWGCVKPE